MDEFVIVLRCRRIFSPADTVKKLISVFVQFVKLIVFNVVEVAFFEIF
jgi:hypothetical protein